MSPNELDIIRAITRIQVDQVYDDIVSLRLSGASVEVTADGIHVTLPPSIKANDLRLTSVTLLNTGVVLADTRNDTR